MNYKLIYSIVPQYGGELITNAARDAGSFGGTVLMATETSSNGIIQLLGFGDAAKDIALIVVKASECSKVIDAIKKATCNKKAKYGVLFSVDVNQFDKAGNFVDADVINESSVNDNKGEKNMQDNSYKMINVIVNRGYAEDAMFAARKAGAAGGTIVQARGTAKEGDAKFFGAEIVPEKDMLIILVPSDKQENIVNAIKQLKCFQKVGTGIIFSNDVNNFTVLGKK